MSRIRTHNLCFLGFGNVGRALVRLLESKKRELRECYGIRWRITGVATRRIGWTADARGLRPDGLLKDVFISSEGQQRGKRLPGKSRNIREWLRAARADVLFETTPLNRHDGQPAVAHIRAALESGAHAITANKGTIVFAYEELARLARRKGKRFLFESTVMDGAPIFSLFRESLPATELRAFRGILNSTSNLVLSQIEAGLSLEEAVIKAQELGIAEAEPSDDLDGWDAAVKVAALSAVLWGIPLKLDKISRSGIRALDPAVIRAARADGRPYKLVCSARRVGKRVKASVKLQQVDPSDPLAAVDGTSSCVEFRMDALPSLTVTERDPGIETTAYGMLADFIRAVRES
ncbi:MAG: homoserine dehydrogenase [Acidipila sp.]|nr:homoserine dehydrogenase [Acidipila sp.]